MQSHYVELQLHAQQFRAKFVVGLMQTCFRCSSELPAGAGYLLPAGGPHLQAVCRLCWLLDQVAELVGRAEPAVASCVQDGLEELYGVLISGERDAARSVGNLSGYLSSRGGLSGSFRPPSSGNISRGGPSRSLFSASAGDQLSASQAEQRTSVAASSVSDFADSACRCRDSRSRSARRGRRQRSGRKRRSQPSPG